MSVKYVLALLIFLPTRSAMSSDLDKWLEIYKNKEEGFYLISIFDGAIAVPSAFHVTSFFNDELILQGIDKNLNNLGVINFVRSENGEELKTQLTGQSTGECYGLKFKSGRLDGNPMTMVSDGKYVLFVSSELTYLSQILFLPMEERAYLVDKNHSCSFLYDD